MNRVVSYNPYKWPQTPTNGLMNGVITVITPVTTGRGPLCEYYQAIHVVNTCLFYIAVAPISFAENPRGVLKKCQCFLP